MKKTFKQEGVAKNNNTPELSEKKKIYLFPTKKTKRIGAFFADLFVNLILSVLLFEGITGQVGKAITGFYSKSEQIDKYNKNKLDILYDNNLLFYEEDKEYSFNDNLKYSADLYVKYLSFDNSIEQYDVFTTFYTIRDYDNNKLKTKILDFGSEFFDSSKTFKNIYALKEEYSSAFMHKYAPNDEMSESAAKSYDKFVESFFVRFYQNIVLDINNNDLSSKEVDKSYKELISSVEEINLEINEMLVICSIIAAGLSSIILFLVVPFVDKKHRTIAEMILKIERIELSTLTYPSFKFQFSIFLVEFISNLITLMFVPMMSVTFTYLFTMPLLYIPSFVALLFNLVNLIVFLSNGLGKSFKEYLTHSIVCDSSTIDDYYKEIGYGK